MLSIIHEIATRFAFFCNPLIEQAAVLAAGKG